MFSPYDVLRGPDGAYLFTTDYGIIYRCEFRPEGRYHFPELPELADEILSISFYPTNAPAESALPADARVMHTVVALLSRVFEERTNVVFYVVDSADGRHRARQRKFMYWFTTAGAPDIEAFRETIHTGEGDILTALLLHTDNPYKEKIVYLYAKLINEYNEPKLGR